MPGVCPCKDTSICTWQLTGKVLHAAAFQSPSLAECSLGVSHASAAPLASAGSWHRLLTMGHCLSVACEEWLQPARS